jgi:hypothetical protein
MTQRPVRGAVVAEARRHDALCAEVWSELGRSDDPAVTQHVALRRVLCPLRAVLAVLFGGQAPRPVPVVPGAAELPSAALSPPGEAHALYARRSETWAAWAASEAPVFSP